MASAVLALGWSLWLRHRIGLTLVLLWFVSVCVVFPLWPDSPSSLAVDLLAVVPFVAGYLYLMVSSRPKATG